VSIKSDDDAPDILWGAEAIGKAIGRPPRATFHLLESGAIPGRKVGSKWVASRRKLLEALFGEGAR
jgi:hypothetical protein